MIISQRDHLEKVELGRPLQGLINSLVESPIEKLADNLNLNMSWNRPRGDLYHWIPLLNRFDDILASQIKKHHLNEQYVTPHVLDENDEKLLMAVLDFSALLLDSCSNRVIYSSTHRLYELINTFSIPVRLSTLKVCIMVGERHCQTNSSRYYAPQEVKNKFFEFAKIFPPTSHNSSSSNYSLLDVCKNSPVPSKWRMLDFQYYNTNIKKNVNASTTSSPQKKKNKKRRSALNTQKLSPLTSQPDNNNYSNNSHNHHQHSQNSNSRNEGIQHFIISEENLRKFSTQQIYDKAIGQIPPESYFQFGLKVAIAKLFNSKSYESIKLKQQLISIKCLSTLFLALTTSSTVVSSQLFEQEQHLFSFLADLISPENSSVVPGDVHFFAVKTFENISMRRVWGSDIIRTLGGNISHGLMYQKIRAVLKDIKEDRPFDEKAVIHFFNMIANIIDTKGLSQILLNAGLLQLLMEFLPLRTSHRWICSGSVHLINLMFLQLLEALDEFIEADGFKLLRETILYEINFALENPNYGGGPPKHSVVYYNITFRQNNYIRTLLKFVLYLIQSDSGDRMRNLYDSSILATFNSILTNPHILGPEAISNTLSIITSIIHSEPTAFAILSEASVIDTVLNNFASLFNKSEELLVLLPDIIGAICLNKKGLEQVIESNAIGLYLDVFKNIAYTKLLLKEDKLCYLGAAFDELARHYPELKTPIVENVARLVKEIPDIALLHFRKPQLYQEKPGQGGSLYASKDEEIRESQPDEEPLPSWETADGGYLIDNIATFLSELVQTHQRWIVLIEKITIQEWIRLIDIRIAPYDYVLSNGLFSIAGLLRFFDDENRSYGLPHLLTVIKKSLANLHDFIHYESPNESFFSQFDSPASPERRETAAHYMSLFNQINYLLFVLTDVYVTPNYLFPVRMNQLCDYFTSEDGIFVMEELILLFRRVTLEEILIQSKTPTPAIKDATFFQAIDISPIQVTLGEPNDNKNKNFNKTNAKYKNTLQIRFHINRIQTWLGYIFTTLTRMAVQKRYDPQTNTPKLSIQVTDLFTERFLTLFRENDFVDFTNRSAYNLIVLNFLNSLLVIKARSQEQVLITFAIMIMQKGGFKTIRDMVFPYIRQIKLFDPEKVDKVKELKYVDFNIESITLNITKQFLTIVSKIVNNASMMPIPALASLYEDILVDSKPFLYEVNVSFLVQARLYGLGILMALLNQDDGILCSEHNIRNFTLPIVELIINIGKVIYSSAGEEHVRFHLGKLYPLNWKLAKPSTFKLEYLENVLGLDSATAAEFMKITDGDLLPLRHPDFMHLEFSDKVEEDWTLLGEKAQEHPFEYPPISPVDPQYLNFTTHDELIFLRTANESNFLDQWLMLLQFFPESVFRISDLLLEVFSRSLYGRKIDFQSTVLVTILEFIESFDFESVENTSKLEIMLHLFGLLLQEDGIFYHSQGYLEEFLDVLTASVKPEFANRDWFPKLLLSFERILADAEVPVMEKFDVACPAFFQKLPEVYRVDEEVKEGILDQLLAITEFTKVDSALSVCRILILYAKDFRRALKIVDSGILKLLVSSLKLSLRTPKAFSYQSGLIVLIRRCLESPQLIKEIMTYELESTLGIRSKVRHKGLPSILRTSAPLVLRSDEVFVDAIAPMIYLENSTVPLTTLTVKTLDPEKATDAEDSAKDDVEMTDVTPELENPSGVIHFLLTELMATSKKDYFSSPAEEIAAEQKFKEEKEKDVKSKEQFKHNPLANENCAYLAFLLQALAEFLCSYKHCKLEFLTFSKKIETDAPLKPRSTALNVLIHKLIMTNKLVKAEGAEFERRCFVSTLARAVIFGFISTPLAKDNLNPDGKKVDPDINFIRQFTCDVLLKILKDTNNSDHFINERYSKTFDLIELTGSLISKNRTQFGSIVDKEAVKYDSYLMSKIMLEKGLPQELTTILAGLDLNYPYSSKISISCLKALNSLGHAKKDYQQLFKEGVADGDEEEMETDDMDPREDTPDLFRNSTLGMYDIEDISDYDYEDDNFAYDEGDALDIVYSDSDMDSENIGSEIEMNEEDEAHIREEDIESIVSDDDDDEDPDDEDDDDDLSDDDIEIMHDPNVAIQIHDSFSEDDYSGSEDYDEDEAEYYSELSFGDEEESISTSDEDLLDEWALNYEAEGGDLDEDFEDERDDGAVDYFDRESSARTPPTILSHDDESDEDLDMEREEDSSDEASLNIRVLANGRTEYQFSANSRRPTETNELALVNPLLQSSLMAAPRTAQLHRVNQDIPTQLPDFIDLVSNATGFSFDGRFPMRDDGFSPLTQLFRMLGGLESRTRADDNFKNLNIRSTQQRWAEFAAMFYKSSAQRDACRVVPKIVNRIFKQSVDQAEKEEKELEEAKWKLEEEHRKLEEEERVRHLEEAIEDGDDDDNEGGANLDLEPVYVTIGDRQVNIAGTDIDPEFFEALPDDMREEVFTQHVRERRATASQGTSSREIDPEFLEALPESLREEILHQEAFASHYASFDSAIRSGGAVAGGDHLDSNDTNNASNSADSKPKEEGKQKLFFSPLLDKAGVSSILRLMFVPESYHHREILHKTLEYLCYNKQTRSEVMGLLLSFLQDGINDYRTLEKSFVQLSARAKLLVRPGNTALTPNEIKESTISEFPSNTSALAVAYQAIESIKYLLESDPHMRYYFLIEHENLTSLRKLNRQRTLNAPTAKSLKYPINSLLTLLNHKIVKQENSLMDVLSRTLQIATRPLSTLKAEKKKANSVAEEDEESPSNVKTASSVSESVEDGATSVASSTKTGIVPPFVPDQNLERIINILLADECSGRTFRQTLSAMQNLSVLPNAQRVFPLSLSEKATNLGQSLVTELKSLVQVISTVTSTEELEGGVLSSFTPASSDQAKLLRVLTALDYLFDSKENGERKTHEVKLLTDLYKKLALGPLWGALSDALKVLQEKSYLSHISTVLLPLIEALMVVCKHSKVKELPIKEAIKYEAKKPDVASEPIESLFFTFTNEHKKILNLMVRTNPKLMSGPFSMLVRNPHVLEFDNKKNFFDRKLHLENATKSTLSVNVRRDQVFLDSFRSLFYKPTAEFKNSKLDIKFRGEDGIDAGGVTREWYQVLSRQMFNADYALFTPVAADKTTFHPNRTSWVNPEHLSFFKFIGRIIGKAVYDNNFLDCHFSRAVYKNILGIPVSLKDMETLDLDYYKSLLWMLENDITDIIDETFSVETDDYGEHKVIDLIEDGRNVPVTEENKQNYVHRIVEYRLQTSITEQMENLLLGFHEIIPKDLIAIFSEQEVELLISGLPDIDVDDWKNNTTYNNYSASSPQIQWFWRAVRSFDVEERAKLLQFATGTSKVPLHGFKELAGVNGVSKFSIHRDYGSIDRLPSSHTCFNQIDLPEYDSYETLRGAIIVAINEGREGFGLA